MTRDIIAKSDSDMSPAERKVEHAKDALAQSMAQLGAEVEVRLKGTIDHATTRVEETAERVSAMLEERAKTLATTLDGTLGTARETIGTARETLDVSAKIRKAPVASLIGATMFGLALSLLKGRHERKRERELLQRLLSSPALAPITSGDATKSERRPFVASSEVPASSSPATAALRRPKKAALIGSLVGIIVPRLVDFAVEAASSRFSKHARERYGYGARADLH